MLNLAQLRDDPEKARELLAHRNQDPAVLDRVLDVDERRRALQSEADGLKAEKNRLGPEIAKRKKAKEDASELLERSSAIAARTKELDQELGEARRALDELLLGLPNLPLPEVPLGEDAEANVEVRQHGQARAFDFEPKDHLALSEGLGLIDMPRGAKLTGHAWPLHTGPGARLERALIQLFLDIQTREHGYTEVCTPFVANRDTMVGTGQLPKFEEDMYRIDRDDLFLIPTSEVTLTNIFRGETLPLDQLPVRLTAYSPCFRREAGAHGKDTRGLQRVHQFNKVELVQITADDKSADAHEAMLDHARTVLERLELRYRVLLLSSGDMGFGGAKTYDLEAYAPASDRWLECSSVSNCLDFQARRMMLRYRDAEKKMRYCHTLNGSGLATPRVFIAFIETHQEADGGIRIPDALRPYMNGLERIPPRAEGARWW